MRIPEVCFIPKRPSGDQPWLEFGGTPDDYRKWAPHICGICCAKMIGDTLGLTNHETLYQLTMECWQNGGFIETEPDSIRGVFHQPLLALLVARGLSGWVERDLTTGKIVECLQQGCFVIASVDLAKLDRGAAGSHLVLIYHHLPSEKAVVLHDCSHVLAEDGCRLQLSLETLAHLSNRKGIIVDAGHSPGG